MPAIRDLIGGGDIADGGAAMQDGFVGVELELALDLQNPGESDFGDCVRAAAAVVGGELLFDMPAYDAIDDASRIAAVRVPTGGGDRIVFAALNGEGTDIRVCDQEEIGERFHGFARAFVSVLTRIRDDLPFGTVEAGGTA